MSTRQHRVVLKELDLVEQRWLEQSSSVFARAVQAVVPFFPLFRSLPVVHQCSGDGRSTQARTRRCRARPTDEVTVGVQSLLQVLQLTGMGGTRGIPVFDYCFVVKFAENYQRRPEFALLQVGDISGVRKVVCNALIFSLFHTYGNNME